MKIGSLVKVVGLEDDKFNPKELLGVIVSFDGGYGIEPLGYHLKDGWLEIGLRKTSAVVLRKLKW